MEDNQVVIRQALCIGSSTKPSKMLVKKHKNK